MRMSSVLKGAFWLILFYLFVTRGQAVNYVINTLGNFTLKSVALFQGRDHVQGVV